MCGSWWWGGEGREPREGRPAACPHCVRRPALPATPRDPRRPQRRAELRRRWPSAQLGLLPTPVRPAKVNDRCGALALHKRNRS